MRTPRCTECGSSDVSFETDDGEWPGEDFFYCDNCDATFRPDTNMTRDEFRGHMKSSGYTTEAAKKTLKKPGKKSSENLKTFKQHKDMLSDMMSDKWSRKLESDFTDSLHFQCGSESRDRSNLPASEIQEIILMAEEAANVYRELCNIDDDDRQYDEIYEEWRGDFSEALNLLKKFWINRVKGEKR